MRFKPIVDKPECVCHLTEVVGSDGGKIHPIPSRMHSLERLCNSFIL
jgi:hypothetical protein